MRTTFLVFLLFSFLNAGAQKLEGAGLSEGSTNFRFHYEDIENFRTVLEIAHAKGDTLQAMKNYFSKGSEGMKAWIGRYGISPERMVKAIKSFPAYYDYLAQTDTDLRRYEDEISKGLSQIKALYPSPFVHIPPVYYFILFAGGGSVEMTANMISVDYFGYHDNMDVSEFDKIGGLFPAGKLALVRLDLIPYVAIHETAHLLQSYAQGEFDYVSIYKADKQTMMAYAIREGGADFLAYLGANIQDTDKVRYGDDHEKELWELFEPLLYEMVDDNKGWFSGTSEDHPDWPFQIGYYMGFKIVEYYYDQAPDKEEAIRQILYSYKPDDFKEFIDTYRKKWN